jgi:large-conductance mechanosensitive channel
LCDLLPSGVSSRPSFWSPVDQGYRDARGRGATIALAVAVVIGAAAFMLLDALALGDVTVLGLSIGVGCVAGGLTWHLVLAHARNRAAHDHLMATNEEH